MRVHGVDGRYYFLKSETSYRLAFAQRDRVTRRLGTAFASESPFLV
ncbi:hypothetical protein [Rubripirellula amarantea]|nr:hypothetical protein [Rubripirellula amarantea]